MDKIEYRNGHIVPFIMFVIMSVLYSLLWLRLSSVLKQLGKKLVFQISIDVVLLIIFTFLVMTFITYNVSHENEPELVSLCSIIFSLFMIPVFFVYPKVIYIVGVFVATPIFLNIL